MDFPITSLKGIGEKRARLFAKIGIKTVNDIVYYLPRSYEEPALFSKIAGLTEGGNYVVCGYICEKPALKRIRKGLNLTVFTVSDQTGRIEVVFFNQPYISTRLKKGEKVYISGKVQRFANRLSFTNPAIEKKMPAEGWLPTYPLTAGLSQKNMRLFVKSALDTIQISDVFPEEFKEKHKLADRTDALFNIHFPKSYKALLKAKYRVLFETLLLFSIALNEKEKETKNAHYLKCDEAEKKKFLNKLWFSPTSAQLRVMREIESDLNSAKPMNRLIQGDVGCGKTAVAFYAMHLCVCAKQQCAMMAPTEVLAAQHFATAQRLFEGVNIELLTGGMSGAQRRAKFQNIASGQTDIIIGTHALLYDNVQFARLGLIVTDEQHRFGVSQRSALESKSEAPHTLTISATPIPRTLALILYGEANLSVIDQMPPGRKPVKTFCVPEQKREAMYQFLEKQISQGEQVFVVCPLIEESDNIGLCSSQQVYDCLSQRFKGYGVSLLHGRLDAQHKVQILTGFRENKFKVLVSTTVIEVGVDVPAATIMVIENAERFGLAQLHQLRGRVGRADKPSFCFLMSKDKNNKRLEVLCKTNDGFKIAKEDLRLRGPGQFLGIRQSGGSDIYMSTLIKNYKLFEKTRAIAQRLKNENPDLYNNLSDLSKTILSEKLDKTAIN